MNVVIIYRQLDGTLGWTACQDAQASDVKRHLRICGHPAVAVIRPKRRNLLREYDDD